jgi:hypothetical protein
VLADDAVDDLLQCKATLMAPLRHADRLRKCLLIGADRKWPALGQSDAIDPDKRTTLVHPNVPVLLLLARTNHYLPLWHACQA